MLTCPICNKKLNRCDRSFLCENGHSFDLAKHNYVNLLVSQSSRVHGDDKQMAAARRDFLNLGYYAKLRECVCGLIDCYPTVDICCGEGYYLEGFAQNGECFGFDISKACVDYAGRRHYVNQTTLAVCNCTVLPIAENCIGTCVSMFGPSSESEVLRVLKDGGKFIRVVPSTEHLYELKSAVYDSPQYNPPDAERFEALTELSRQELKYTVKIEGNEAIKNLFTMTPYYYRTSKSDFARLDALDALNVTLHFEITEYKK